MSIDRNRVIVEEALCSRCFIPTKRVHHRYYPEIRAECNSVAEAVACLADRLAYYRDGAPGAWHRETIDLALQDVAEFLGVISGGARAAESSCHCGPRALDVEEHPLALGRATRDIRAPRGSGTDL